MSFLSTILSTTERISLDNAKRDVSTVSTKILEVKQQVDTYIDDVYRKFTQWPAKNEKLIKTSEQLLSQVSELETQVKDDAVKQIQNKNNDYTDLVAELQRSRIAIDITSNIIHTHELLLDFRKSVSQGLTLRAAKQYVDIEKYLNSLPKDEVTEPILALRINVLSERASLAINVTEKYESYVVLKQRTKQTKSGMIEETSIKVNTEAHLSETLLALHLLENLELELDKFSKFFWEYVCEPVLNQFAIIQVDKGDFATLTVTIKQSSQNLPYTNGLNKLIEVFSFLHKYFNVSVNEVNTVSYISDKIKPALADNVVKLITDDSGPTEADVSEMRTFEEKLIELEIFQADSNPISDYIENMDRTIINKKCQEYLNNAIGIMKKDLHDSVEVGVVQEEEFDPNNVGKFLKCSISRSTTELIELTEKLLQQALEDSTSETFAIQIVVTVQSFFNQYGNIVHAYHERLLQTIPQQVALFRNNCMYLSHKLIELNTSYTKRFPKTVLPTSQLFMDQGHHLRTTAEEIFSTYVKNQIGQTEATLEEGQVTSSKVEDKLNPDTDKYLRQCMRQYELLKTVWLKVLPNSTYNKTLGQLFDSFCRRLIELAVKARDIPSANAEQLVEMYNKIVLTRGPKLFANPHEITLHVESWQKLNDLVFILGSSLIEISDRWADGKGPLTLTFQPEEVRELIKALFQNTDRRAAVLSRIR